MAKIKLKIVGSTKVVNRIQGDEMNVANISEIVRRQKMLDNYEYNYMIFINNVRIDDESKNLHDGDEVLLVPIAIGG